MTASTHALSDWRELVLAPGGRSLVEASAGTGKTWTIGVLYLRLLLEQALSPRQIVVATYTQAAAAELTERLRGRIESSLAWASSFAIDTPPTADRTDLCWLHERWCDPAQRDADLSRLRLVLAELDLAPIGTLHRLCTRILSEHPFAAGAAFQTPSLVNADALLGELTDDLWRLLHGPEPDDTDTFTLWQAARDNPATTSRATLAQDLGSLLLPGVQVPPPSDDDNAIWESAPLATLREVAGNASHWRKGSKLPQQLLELAAAVEARGKDDVLTDVWLKELLSRAEKRTGVLKGVLDDKDIGTALAFVIAFVPRYRAHLQSLQLAFLAHVQRWARGQIDQRLAQANQLGFDDLLTSVERALTPDEQGRRVLADALFTAWPVALIDEFQDTDPTQYGILDAIYRDAENNPRGRLLMIGDPKQAIYRFRGGDIHTYTRAAASANRNNTLRLDVNRRSSQAYVEAINTFYCSIGEKLGSSSSQTGIAYVPVHAAPGAERARYTIDAAPAPALVLHLDGGENASDEISALLSCATRIATLLAPDSDHRIDGRPLLASDICVLLPSNRQVQQMIQLLRERNIASVNRGRGSVFASDTARDLLLILDATLHCDQDRRLNAALATPLWGTGYHALRHLQQQPAQWQAIVAHFHQWHHNWPRVGVLGIVSAIVQQVAARQLSSSQGERVLTDLRHLGELLQDASDDCDGPESLLAWMRQQMDDGDGDEDAADARALRLESDAHCAQVMTLHASKGLEFALVFLPLMWKHGGSAESRRRGLALLSMDDGSRRVVLDAAQCAQVALEEQDERFRTLYVALTRARFGCQVWLPKPASTSVDTLDALAAPIMQATIMLTNSGTAVAPGDGSDHSGNDTEAPDTLDADAGAGSDVTTFDISPGWPATRAERLPRSSSEHGRDIVRPLPPRRSGPLPMRHSFTTLSTRAPQPSWEPEAAASDELQIDELLPIPIPATAASATTATARTRDIALDHLQDVAGPQFGNAIHAILELRQIGCPLREQDALVQAQLAAFAVRDRQLDMATLAARMASRLDAVLDADLDGSGLRLGALPAGALRCEMEFHYALDGASLARLRALCEQAGYPDMIPARQQVLSGLMNGKIDLIFRSNALDGRLHVLDWKSNRLGGHDAALEDYAPAALETAMDAAGYRFQALLYAIAVERHLQSRLGTGYDRARHLGDCWYLFVRATGLRLPDGTHCGIWRHRFDDALLDAVQHELATRMQEAA